MTGVAHHTDEIVMTTEMDTEAITAEVEEEEEGEGEGGVGVVVEPTTVIDDRQIMGGLRDVVEVVGAEAGHLRIGEAEERARERLRLLGSELSFRYPR